MKHDRFGIAGKVVARTYQVEEAVAEGGFGVVYRAYHKGFRAQVALKCLKIPTELTDRQRLKFLEQFRSEAEVLFRLSGKIPNIVRPLHVDAFHLGDGRLVPFMALEWLEGRTLDAIIVRRAEKGRTPIELEKLVRLLTPVAAGLEQAHHLPGPDGTMMTVVHRDMKPENLFVARIGDEDVAKVLDFGISKVKGTAELLAGRASQDASAVTSFSPAYGAPEQWAPKSFGQTGRWTDVWGLALTVVEAAKGDEVVTGDYAGMMGTILDAARRPTPQNHGVAVSDAVESVFGRALALDPRERYQTVGRFWDDLTEALGVQAEVGSVSIRLETASAVWSRRGLEPDFDSLLPPSNLARASSPSAGHGSLAGDHSTPLQTLDPGGSTRDSGAGSTGEVGGSRPKQPSRISLLPIPSMRPRRLGAARGNVAAGEVSSRRSRQPPSSGYRGSFSRDERPSMLKALTPALALVVLSIAFTLLDRAVVTSRGEPLAIGPVRASWIAAACMVLALVRGFSAVRKVIDH